MPVTRKCRMRRAMTLLRTEQSTLASVTSRVGHGSEAAFSTAFVRHTCVSPVAGTEPCRPPTEAGRGWLPLRAQRHAWRDEQPAKPIP